MNRDSAAAYGGGGGLLWGWFNASVRPALAIAAVVLAALIGAGLARPDGDPASDVLPTDDVYMGYRPPGVMTTLDASIARVFASGHRIKVALILNPHYLGSIPSLFGKPAAYAHFLGQELIFVYRGPLLVVMPSGFGIWDANHSTAAEVAVLRRLKVRGKSMNALIASAKLAVDALAAANALTSPDTKPPAVFPRSATAHPGKTAKLVYSVVEDSERSSEIVTVRSGSKVLAVLHSAMQSASYGVPHSVNWRVPSHLPRKRIVYCVVATDPSGNTSAAAQPGSGFHMKQSACSPITIVR